MTVLIDNDNDSVFIFNHEHDKCLREGTPAKPKYDQSRIDIDIDIDILGVFST